MVRSFTARWFGEYIPKGTIRTETYTSGTLSLRNFGSMLVWLAMILLGYFTGRVSP